MWPRSLLTLLMLLSFASIVRAQNEYESNLELGHSQPVDTEPLIVLDRSRWNAGASVLVLQPFASNDQAFVRLSGAGGPNPVSSAREFDWNLKPALNAWIGWTDPDGVGMRARYFYFDNNSQTANGTNTGADSIRLAPGLPDPKSSGVSLFASPGDILNGGFGTDVFSFRSSLTFHVIDLEATHVFDWNCGQLILSAGGRFADIRHDYSGQLTNAFAGATELQTVDFNQNFHGGGPTIALDFRRPIGNSTLNLLAGLRGSLLVGVENQSFLTTHTVTDPGGLVIPGGGTINLTDRFQQRSLTVLPITELELGFEYLLPLGNESFFLQATAIQQTYFGAGSVSDPNQNLALFGARFGFGYQW